MTTVKAKYFYIILLLFISLYSCSDDGTMQDEVTQEEPGIDLPADGLSEGAGNLNYTYAATAFSKTLEVYYYIPEGTTPTTPILFVFHGNGRNAKDYRDAMVEKADELEFIVIVPKFSVQNFPGGDGYILGNVFIDGDNPSTGTLNPEAEWTFSIIEPLFDELKVQLDNTNSTYTIFGHSAGGQFAHRLLMFKPDARVDKIVASASGWYTFPYLSIAFPYGFKNSPLEESSLAQLFSKQIHIQVGDNDDNPNAAALRHNDIVDMQGLNRKTRATNFFNYSQQLALDSDLPFNWSFNITEDADHDYIKASENAADFLFN